MFKSLREKFKGMFAKVQNSDLRGSVVSLQDFAAVKLAAEKGDAIARNNLGVTYAAGQGISKNDAAGKEGQKVEQNYTEAIKWFRLAAEQGNVEAQCNLATLYYYGRGVDQDYAETIKWLRLAADRGDTIAQFNLGEMYAQGLGVAKDQKEAERWHKMTERGSQDVMDAHKAKKNKPF